MIEVTNLTKKYGEHVAVDHLSFRVEKGQIYGFLGPNGAGKSTTMNIITGYIAPSEGTVTIDGRDIQKEPEEARKRIGYLPELPPLYTEMTVEEYLCFAAQLKKLPRLQQKPFIEKGMEMTGTVDVRGRLIRNLSKGYRQRVGLAQAILGDPEVIILDEPSVGLDPKQIIEMRDLIRSLGEEHTIILSSHILSEVSAVCDHIMIISHGHLVASDSPEGLQKLKSGSMELQLTVKGTGEQLRTVLETVPGVSSVETLPAPREAFARVKLVTVENMDIREPLFYALSEARLPVMEMTASEKSLEDIFLELTQEPGQDDMQPHGKKLFGGRRRKRDAGEPGGAGQAENSDNAEDGAAGGTVQGGSGQCPDRIGESGEILDGQAGRAGINGGAEGASNGPGQTKADAEAESAGKEED